jgi:hypothetical protein
MRIFTDINLSKEHRDYHERAFLQALFFEFYLNHDLLLIFSRDCNQGNSDCDKNSRLPFTAIAGLL